jgi:hypothetical protein
MSAPWLQREVRKPDESEIPQEVKDVVRERAGGYCECCGGPCYVGDHAYHHRRPVGMGGSKSPETHSVPNVVLICGRDNRSRCHGDVHQNPEQAYAAGWLVKKGAHPHRIPLLLHNGRTVLLDVNGSYVPIEESA